MFTCSAFSIRSRALALLLFASCTPVFGSSDAVLMLDFGPTEATGESKTNSPYHSENESFKESHWNTIDLANVASGLVFANGQPAEGVSITWGASVQSSQVDFSQGPTSSSELGAAIDITMNGSVFSGSSVGKDGVFTPKPLGNNLVGIKIGGLDAGRYEVYVVGLNTSNGTRSQSPCIFYAAATPEIGTFDTADLEPSATALLNREGTLKWIEGASYVKMTVELEAGNDLVIVAGSLGPDQGGTESRGFLNAVQVVPVAKP